MRADGEGSSTFRLQAKTVFIPRDDARAWSLGAGAGAARDTNMPRGGPAFQTCFGLGNGPADGWATFQTDAFLP